MGDKVIDEDYHLSNGVEIPKLGLGTWLIDEDRVAGAVRQAIDIGYRHIDTAEAYGNERGVGRGVRESGLPRSALFVTTKLAAEAKTYDQAAQAIEGSLRDLDLDYIDLMIIHSPQPWDDFRGGNYDEGNRQAWKALEEAYESGSIRAIGVSNFTQADIENILSSCTVRPMVNQVLMHIGHTPLDLMDYCHREGILMEAYSPVAHGAILDDPKVSAKAARYGVTPARLCIRYDLQLGALPLPKAENPGHMRENVDVDFDISADDMEALKCMTSFGGYGKDERFPVFSGK